jgi:uncharacterized membrane protein YedE/YeeE
MYDFTPIHALVGGALIAISLATMLLLTGRIAGLSGVFAGCLRGTPGDWGWRVWFLGGALAVGAVFELAAPSTFDAAPRVPLWVVALAGACVGLGTRLSNGCTSGHGLCGMSRLSKRSIVATLVFFGVGVATATITGAIVRAS